METINNSIKKSGPVRGSENCCIVLLVLGQDVIIILNLNATINHRVR